jgi:hypothetical protein
MNGEGRAVVWVQKRDGDTKITEHGEDRLPAQLKPVTARRRCEKGRVGRRNGGSVARESVCAFERVDGWRMHVSMCPMSAPQKNPCQKRQVDMQSVHLGTKVFATDTHSLPPFRSVFGVVHHPFSFGVRYKETPRGPANPMLTPGPNPYPAFETQGATNLPQVSPTTCSTQAELASNMYKA